MSDKEWKYSDSYVKVLDGIRAMAILLIAWYHIWQQSWLQPIKEVEWLSVFHCNSINFDWLVRTGFEMVDMMLLLSGLKKQEKLSKLQMTIRRQRKKHILET